MPDTRHRIVEEPSFTRVVPWHEVADELRPNAGEPTLPEAKPDADTLGYAGEDEEKLKAELRELIRKNNGQWPWPNDPVYEDDPRIWAAPGADGR